MRFNRIVLAVSLAVCFFAGEALAAVRVIVRPRPATVIVEQPGVVVRPAVIVRPAPIIVRPSPVIVGSPPLILPSGALIIR